MTSWTRPRVTSTRFPLFAFFVNVRRASSITERKSTVIDTFRRKVYDSRRVNAFDSLRVATRSANNNSFLSSRAMFQILKLRAMGRERDRRILRINERDSDKFRASVELTGSEDSPHGEHSRPRIRFRGSRSRRSKFPPVVRLFEIHKSITSLIPSLANNTGVYVGTRVRVSYYL